MTMLRGITNNGSAPEPSPDVGNDGVPALHRISEVRQQQGVSLRSAARRMGTEVSRLKVQEQETADLRLSDLYQWQQALEVPVSDLLVEQQGSLSRPVMERAQMVLLMKTAAAILEQSNSSASDLNQNVFAYWTNTECRFLSKGSK